MLQTLHKPVFKLGLSQTELSLQVSELRLELINFLLMLALIVPRNVYRLAFFSFPSRFLSIILGVFVSWLFPLILSLFLLQV